MATEWYHSRKWSAKIEAKFFDRLKRLRRPKEQGHYLVQQADQLIEHGELAEFRVAERLLRLKLTEHSSRLDDAWAWTLLANCHCRLGEIQHAVDAYHAAFRTMEQNPLAGTNAAVHFGIMCVQHGLVEQYESVQKHVSLYEDDAIVPLEVFRVHAVKSIILAHNGDHEAARDHARAAIEAARDKHSGISRHPKLGLVGAEETALLAKVKAIAHRP